MTWLWITIVIADLIMARYTLRVLYYSEKDPCKGLFDLLVYLAFSIVLAPLVVGFQVIVWSVKRIAEVAKRFDNSGKSWSDDVLRWIIKERSMKGRLGSR